MTKLKPRLLVFLILCLMVTTLSQLISINRASAAVTTWRALFLVYRSTDVTFTWNGQTQRVRTSMSSSDLQKALYVIRRVPSTVYNWSRGNTYLSQTIVYPDHPISSVTSLGANGFWVSPLDIKADINKYAPQGRYDSIFVIWRLDTDSGKRVPSLGWGWTVRPGPWANGAGYTTVNIPQQHGDWLGRYPEQIFLHEWTHQVTGFYEQLGYRMPNIDRASDYGYSREEAGQVFLSDVLSGRVPYGSTYIGVKPSIWASSTPRYLYAAQSSNYLPRVTSLTPGTGTSYVGRSYSFTATYYDSNGAKNINKAYIKFQSSYYNRSVNIWYNQDKNKIYMKDLSNGVLYSAVPGKDVVLRGNIVQINARYTTVSLSGNQLTIRWSIVFEPRADNNNYRVLASVRDDSGAYPGYKLMAYRYVR